MWWISVTTQDSPNPCICSSILSFISYADPQWVTISSFSRWILSFSWSCAITKSRCFFLKKTAMALLHILNALCTRESLRPFLTTKFMLWPKQPSLFQWVASQDNLMFELLFVVIPCSLIFHCCKVLASTYVNFQHYDLLVCCVFADAQTSAPIYDQCSGKLKWYMDLQTPMSTNQW